MKHPLATADFTFPLLSHEKVLDLVRLLEFDGVDIGLFEERSHLWPSREFENTEASAAQLKKSLDDRGLSCADVFLQMAPDFVPFAINHPDSGPREKARDWFRHALDYAGGVGSPHITALPGVLFENEAPEDSWGRARDELAWRVEQAGDDEHAHLKHACQFGLAAGAFEELAPEQTEADTGTESGKGEDQTDGNSGTGLDLCDECFHLLSPGVVLCQK